MHFHFKGVAAHASVSPWQGRSALHAVELMDAGVNFAREQLKEDARVQYVISNGGGQPNVIPAEAESWYVVRADKHDEVSDIVQWIIEIAKGAAAMTRTQVEVRIDDDNPEVLPNRPLAEVLDRNLQLVGTPQFSAENRNDARKLLADLRGEPQAAEERIATLPAAPTQGAYSTDLGSVSWNVPTERLAVALSPFVVPPHTWQWVVESGTVGLKDLPVAAKALAGSAIDLLKDSALRDRARLDFEQSSKGKHYTLLTPPGRKPPAYSEEANSKQ
jgi:aminobenzoyl-glutamate utilization protein B